MRSLWLVTGTIVLLAAGAQAQPPAFPVEQGRADMPLEFGQGHADGRLGQEQLLRRGAHAARRGDLHKGFELLEADRYHQFILFYE